MSDEPDAPAWVWQGFFGPMAAAIAGKAITDALDGAIAGVTARIVGSTAQSVAGGPTGVTTLRLGGNAAGASNLFGEIGSLTARAA